jgi:hypothetical protein
MRRLRKKCIVQRGCDYCLDRIPPAELGDVSRCPHFVCPYHELDEAESYKEYLKSISDFTLGEMLNITRKVKASEAIVLQKECV